MGMSRQIHTPAAVLSAKELPTPYWKGAWVGPRADLDTTVERKNLLPLPGIEARSFGRPARSAVAILAGS
jgi:hypothetical protein